MQRLNPGDKKVIRAFTEKKSASSKKLETDGKRLDGAWGGGRGIAEWRGGKIQFRDLGSKSAQIVQNAVRKEAPKNWLGGWVKEGVAAANETLERMVGALLIEADSAYGFKEGQKVNVMKVRGGRKVAYLKGVIEKIDRGMMMKIGNTVGSSKVYGPFGVRVTNGDLIWMGKDNLESRA